jgi:hypothetical protein
MNSITNLSQSNKTDTTQVFFNNYFKPSFSLAPSIDDAVLSFFEKITANKDSAKLLASSVVYTSIATNTDPMQTLSKFASMTTSDLNTYTTLFLNFNRVGTSYLGISKNPRIGKYIERTLLP